MKKERTMPIVMNNNQLESLDSNNTNTVMHTYKHKKKNGVKTTKYILTKHHLWNLVLKYVIIVMS